MTSFTAGRSSPFWVMPTNARFLACAGLGLERRHPHDAPPSPRHTGHLLDGFHVDAADGAAQINPAEYLEPGHLFANEVGDGCRRLPVALQHEPAHASRASQPGDVERVDSPRLAVRDAVHVEVDRTAQRPLGFNGLGRLGRARCAARYPEHCDRIRNRGAREGSGNPGPTAGSVFH
jgi:hypothetical protein